MTQQVININPPGGGTGDTLHDGGAKINANFTELYANPSNQNISYVTTAASPNNADLGIKAATTQFLGYDTTKQFEVDTVAKSVNYLSVQGAITNSIPTLTAKGSDTNVAVTVAAKGLDSVYLGNGVGVHLQVDDLGLNNGGTSNWVQVSGNVSGASPVIQPVGTDTNIDLTLSGKGTGGVKLGVFTANTDLLTADMTQLPYTGWITVKDSSGVSRKLLVHS